MQDTKQWLDEKLKSYKENKETTLEELLFNTTEVIGQHVSNPTSQATFGLLESVLFHNTLFLEQLEKLEESQIKDSIDNHLNE